MTALADTRDDRFTDILGITRGRGAGAEELPELAALPVFDDMLTRLLGDSLPHGLVVVSGFTGAGKTLAACRALTEAVGRGLPVGLVDADMGGTQSIVRANLPGVQVAHATTSDPSEAVDFAAMLAAGPVDGGLVVIDSIASADARVLSLLIKRSREAQVTMLVTVPDRPQAMVSPNARPPVPAKLIHAAAAHWVCEKGTLAASGRPYFNVSARKNTAAASASCRLELGDDLLIALA